MSSYGPQLPPGFRGSSVEPKTEAQTKPTYGPIVPVELLERKSATEPDSEDSSSTVSDTLHRIVIGPEFSSDAAQPRQNDMEQLSKRIMGPQLPPEFQKAKTSETSTAPAVDDNDDVIGPSLSLMADEKDYSVAEEVTRRMERAAEKAKKAQQPIIQERESWMTELPEALLGRSSAALLPTGPRSFKRRADEYEADFSGWTSDPNKKNSCQPKEKDPIEVLQYQQSLERESKLEQQVAEHNKEKRGEALATIVQKAKKPEEPTERRPFDRERDLNIRKIVKLDEKEIAKRADALKDRFSSSGSGQKFL